MLSTCATALYIDFKPLLCDNTIKIFNHSQDCKVRWASNHLIVSVYRVPQMQGVGHAGVLLYFKCPTTKQMRCPVNAYQNFWMQSIHKPTETNCAGIL